MYKYSHRSKKLDGSNVEIYRLYAYEGDQVETEFTIEVVSGDSRKTLDALEFLVKCLKEREEERIKHINNMLAN